jgi:hypothetical protein
MSEPARFPRILVPDSFTNWVVFASFRFGQHALKMRPAAQTENGTANSLGFIGQARNLAKTMELKRRIGPVRWQTALGKTGPGNMAQSKRFGKQLIPIRIISVAKAVPPRQAFPSQS